MKKWWWIGVLTLLFSCGESDEKANNNANNANNGNNENNAAQNCQSRCEARAASCDPMAMGQMLTAFCQNEICSYSPNETEVMCLENGPCTDVQVYAFDPDQDPCGFRTTTSNNVNNMNSMNNGTCTPGCDANGDLVECDDLNGTPVKTTIACGGLGCQNGACVQSFEVCTPGFSDGGGCPGECNAGSVIVNGNTYCSARCGPNDECPSGTSCNTNLNGGECLPTCVSASDCPDGFLDFCPDSGFCGS